MATTKRRTQHTPRRAALHEGTGAPGAIREMIGREARLNVAGMKVKSIDATITNYRFWDRFRRCAAQGYELSGAFARVITQTLTAWVIGERAPHIRVDLPPDADEALTARVEYTNGLLADFTDGLSVDLQTLVDDLYGLGDQYLILNPDGTISIPSPDAVTVERDALDYRRVLAYTITTNLDAGTITDRYTATERTLSILRKGAQQAETLTFDNLIGMIPVVQWSNDRGANETNGRPIYEGLLHNFSRYDDLIQKMVDGAELMGNPVPTLEGMRDPLETIQLNGSATDDEYVDDVGESHPRYRIRFDALSTMVVGDGGTFKFTTPPVGFTNDTRATLKSLWMLIMEHTRIPEAFWGNELSSARASASEQLKTFYKYIESRRLAIAGTQADAPDRGGLLRLARLWLLQRALTDPQIVVDEALRVEWASLSQQDAQIVREWAALLHERGTIRDATLVGLSDLVDDPAAEVDLARQEAEERADPFEANMIAMLSQPEPEPDGDSDAGNDDEDAA